MVKRTRRSKIGARVFAAIMSVALGISNMSGMMPGAVAFAETPDESGDGNSLPGQTAEETEKSENAESNAQDFAEDEKSDSAVGEGSDTESSGSFEEGTDNGTGASGDEVSDEELDPSKLSAETEEESDETKGSENKESEEAEVKDGSLLKSEDNSSSVRNFDYSKTDVWDFGAEDLGDEYNNRLDVDTINGFYSAEPGTKGPNLASFSVDDGDFVFNDGGYSTTHRLRSTNTSITRYDEKSLKDSDGNVYSGYIYSNKSKTADVYVAVECQADDIITAYVASNGADSEVHFENMSDSTDSAFFTHSLGGSTVSKFVYYPSETAKYKFYSATEKLVLARALRKHATYSELSGAVAGYTGTGSFDLVFTNRQNGNEVRATVSDGTYSVNLAEGFDYDLSLDGADEYVITSDKEVNISGSSTMDIEVASVDLALVRGNVEFVSGAGVPEGFAQSLNLVFTPEDENSVYVPQFVMEEDGSFEVSVQAGVNYQLTAEGVDDYELLTKAFKATGDVNNAVISFVRRVVFPIIADIDCEGLAIEDLADAQFKFILLDMEDEVKDTKYSYTFTGRQFIDEEVVLRDGQYRLEVTNVPEGYKFDEDHSYDAIIAESDSAVDYTLKIPFVSTAAPEKTAYRETVTVGQGKEFETISEALEAIRNMERTDDQRVTVEIDPGDYQEMLVIDTPNVTFKNTSAGGSIVPTNQGVSIASDSVRITGYYGHGYAYYSMGKDCKYDAKLLEVNKHNGYPLFENPGSGTTAGSYWNATVVVNAEGFEAYDIIFENSFNQYQSELAAADTIVKLSSAKEDKGVTTRAELPVGSTAVQSKNYVERAAAMAIRAAAKETYFNHCAFIGRQDTLYGDEGSTQAYYDCDIYGGTDYIFGGMTAVFAKCNLIFNTSEDNNDVGYITAAQQKNASSRGYLMYNCTVKSTVPGENTASAYGSKAGYLGRPWQPTTSEVVFYDTVIEKTCDQYSASSASLINPEGWLSTLSGTTERNVEYGTFEVSGVDNSSARVAWSPVSDKAETTDGKTIAVSTFLGSWDPFTANGDDLTVAFPDGTTVDAPVAGENENSSDNSVFTLEASALDAFAAAAKADGETQAAGTDNFFTVVYSTKSKVDASTKTWEDGYTSGQRINFGGAASADKNAIKFTTDYPGSVKIWWAEGGDNNRQMGLFKSSGDQVAVTEGTWTKNDPYITSFDIPEAGSYYIGGVENNNYIFKVEVTLNLPVVYEFESSSLDAFAAGDKADGATVVAGTDNYFTLIFSSKSKVDSSSKTWEDDYTSGQRVNFGGVGSLEQNAIKFTTSSDNATVKVWWVEGGDNNRQINILNGAGEEVATTSGTWTKNSPYISTLELGAAGTYYLGSSVGGNYIFRVAVTEGGGAKPPRADWEGVPDPVISDIAVEGGKINVTVQAYINYNGADNVSVVMKDEKDDVVDEKKSSKEGEDLEKVLTFEPSASGKYTFVASLNRDGEESKVSAESEAVSFVLPLAKPSITAITNKGLDSNGKGKLEISWTKVEEAKKYDVEIVQISEEETAGDTQTTGETETTVGRDATVTAEVKETVLAKATGLTEREVVLGGLPVGENVTVKVYAVRDSEKSEPATKEAEVTGNNDRTWKFASYGSNGSANDSATANEDGSVDINTPSSTKIVPGSTDGLGYYYTKMDPTENFTLTAKIRVNAWPFDNGQEGFGLMVADAVGEHGHNAAFWNNSYQAAATQIQYNWDPTVKDANGNYVGGVTNVTADSATVFQEKMRLGLGWIAKSGVTLDQKLKTESGQITTPDGFSTVSGTFETSVASAIQAQLPGITSESSAAEVQEAFKNSAVETIGGSVAAFGQYNIIDSSKAAKTVGETVRRIGNVEFTDVSEVRYQIQRNNTGYILRYLSNDAIGNEDELDIEYVMDEAGNRISYMGTYNGRSVVAVDGKVYEVLSQKVIYDQNRNSLTMIDKKYIYLGMFSARKTAVTVEEYSLETVDPEDDYPAEARAYEAVDLNTQIISAQTSNTADYDLIFTANADGTLTVTQESQSLSNTTQSVVNESKIIAREMEVTAGKWATIGSTLKAGDNTFKLVFTPAAGYTPGEYQYLVINKDDPEAKSVSLDYSVSYKALSGDTIYVAPGGNGDGSKENPASIYAAVSYAAPGQKIYLKPAVYNLGRENGGSNKNIRIDRGINGTKNNMILMETDPDEGGRATLDFSGATGTGSAFVLSGNYWHLKNFDITGSKNGEKGLLVAGKHNIVEMVNAYENGNTGIEIARDGNVGRDLWPSDNLILNCTSYLNYDAGFEDADGFAAKITAGDNNRFVGCVSAYNADDGWDLFAKVQTGSIGVVTIEGCVAYKNGYLLGRKDGQDYEVFIGADAVEFEAGNGNGFKLGGDGLSGYHVLKNSYAFGNKANGIDSNSCPDVQVFNSVSYANGTNLVLNNYAKAINSDYTVQGLISVGGSKTDKDSISMLGAQIASKIYNSSNFFWNGSESVNAGNSGMKVTSDIFRSLDPADMGVNKAEGNFANRDGQGNILFGDFLQLKTSEEVTDASLKAALEFIENNGIGVNEQSSAITQTPELVVLAKDVKTLSDVESKELYGATLPEGYTWVNGNTAAATYAGTSARFGIVNKETGDTSEAIVSFVTITGVELEAVEVAEGGLFDGEEFKLEAVPVYSPDVALDPESDMFSYSFADKKKLGLEESVSSNTITLRRKDTSKVGIANYVATLTYMGGGRKQTLTSNGYSFTTRKEAVSFEFEVEGAEFEADGKVLVGQVGDKFKLNGLKVLGVGEKDGVSVAVGDSRILKYTKGEFVAVGTGTTFITLTAVADKSVQKVLVVKVKGKEFALSVSSLTVDKAKNDGTSFTVSKLGDSELENVTISKILKGTKERAELKDIFEIRKVIGNVYTISVKPDTDENGVETLVAPKIANGSYTLVLTSGENEFDPVTLVITETRPAVSLKQTKRVNLFYKAGSTNNTGLLKATSSLAAVTLSQASEGDYNLSYDGSQYQIIMTDAAQKKIDSRGRLNNTLKLTASFDGYKKAYNRTVNFTVGTQTVAPRYKLELAGKVLYTELGIKDTELKVLDRNTGEYLSDAQIKLATSSNSYIRANKYFTLDEDGGVYRLSTTRTGTAKISVVDPDFSKNPATKFTTDREVILDATLVINNRKPAVSIANVRINGQAGIAATSRCEAKVVVSNTTDYILRNLELTGNNKSSRNIIPFIDYSYERNALDQPVIAISFKDSEDKTLEQAISEGIIKAGSYSLKANFDINKIQGRSANFVLTVMTGARARGIVSGKINPVDRSNSYATVKPQITNLGGTVTGMYFKAAEDLFDVEWDSTKGVAKVYATEEGIYRANANYTVTPVFAVSTANGVVELEAAPVNISVKQTRLTLSRIPEVEVKISDMDQEGMVVVKATSPKAAEIASVAQLSQNGRFNVRYDARSGNLYISIADIKNVTANKRYNLSLGIVPEGNGVGASQQTFNVKVRVIR